MLVTLSGLAKKKQKRLPTLSNKRKSGDGCKKIAILPTNRANPNPQNKNGETPLFFAVINRPA